MVIFRGGIAKVGLETLKYQYKRKKKSGAEELVKKISVVVDFLCNVVCKSRINQLYVLVNLVFQFSIVTYFPVNQKKAPSFKRPLLFKNSVLAYANCLFFIVAAFYLYFFMFS